MSLNLDSFLTQMINSMRRGKKKGLSFPTHVPTVKKLIKKRLWQSKRERMKENERGPKNSASQMRARRGSH